MDLSADARKVMEALSERFVVAGMPNPWYWAIAPGEVGEALDDLVAAGLLARMDSGRTSLHLTEAARTWILESRGLVVVFCPKCSTDEYLPKGDPNARARCHVCGVTWTDDTTKVPFVPRY